jgi:hypothetical protein
MRHIVVTFAGIVVAFVGGCTCGFVLAHGFPRRHRAERIPRHARTTSGPAADNSAASATSSPVSVITTSISASEANPAR